jgi:serine phosphatase RsbU (regulator of sigma subunit)
VAVRALDPGVVQNLRLRGFDFLERLVPRQYQPMRVEIVAIDDKSLAQYGQWPWSRARVAQLVDRIAAGKPSVLGVDIIFAEPDRLSPGRLVDSDPEIPAQVASELAKLPTHESVLADALRKVPTVLAVAGSDEPARAPHPPSRVTMILESGGNPRPFLLTHPELLRSLPEVEAAERGDGAIDQVPDPDGITRSVPLFIFAQGKLVPDLALEMLRVGSGAGAVRIVTGKEGVNGATLGPLSLPTDRHGRIYPYFTPSYEARYISAADLLNGKYDPSRFKRAAVLLGSSALGLTEQDHTPLGLMPGVEVWAQSLESMLTENLLRRPAFMNFVEIAIVLVAGLVIIFALPYSSPRIAGASLLGIVALLFGSALGSFKFSELLLDGVYPALSSTLVFGVMLSENLRITEAGRRRLASELQHEREIEARLDGELNAARAIQIGLLPRHFPGPPERTDVEVFASIEPARMVGGDLYDFVLLDSELLSFVIADVSGKGVPAALFMAMTKEVLHTATLRYRNALDRVFDDANAKIAAASEELAEGGADMMFVTVFAGILDLASGMLVYVNAGHDAPFLIRDGSPPRTLALAGGPPLGTVDDFQYSIEQRQLAPGETVLAYTDGVTEAQDVKRTLYSGARLERLLATAPASSAKGLVDFVRDDVHRFAAGAEQADDITVLAVRWLGPKITEGDFDAPISRLGDVVSRRNREVQLPAARDRDRFGADAVVFEARADHLGAAHRELLIVGLGAERVGMPNHLDFVHLAPLDVAEHGLILALRVGRKRVTVLLEIEHEVAGQHGLRGQRVAEDLLHLSLIDLHRRGDATAHLAGRIRFIQQHRLLAVLDRHRARAPVRIRQHDEQRLAAGTRREQKQNWNQYEAAHERLLFDFDDKPGAAHTENRGGSLDLHRAGRAARDIARHHRDGAAIHVGQHRALEITRVELVILEHDLTVGAARHHGVVDKGDADRAVGAGLDGVLLVERIADFGGGARSVAHDLSLS